MLQKRNLFGTNQSNINSAAGGCKYSSARWWDKTFKNLQGHNMSPPPPALHIWLISNIRVNFLSVNLAKCSCLEILWWSLKELFSPSCLQKSRMGSLTFFRSEPAYAPHARKSVKQILPWWALICGKTLWSSSNDFLWYSAWTSISYPRQNNVSERKITMVHLLSVQTLLYLLFESSLHSQFLWPQNCTYLLITDPGGGTKCLNRENNKQWKTDNW